MEVRQPPAICLLRGRYSASGTSWAHRAPSGIEPEAPTLMAQVVWPHGQSVTI
ncbi:MAG: hypothetical protein WDO73_21130 [Ignavibacteriota bacterium]